MKLRWVVAALVAALVVGLWSAPASAAKKWTPLQLSLNGKTWSTELDKPLFRKTTMVPGDSVARTFYVRNRGDSAANLLVSVKLKDPNALVSDRGFRLNIGSATAWNRVKVNGDRGTEFKIPRGGSGPVRVKLRMLTSSLNPIQFRSFDFTLKLKLTQAGR